MYQQQQQQPGAAMLYTASGQPVALTVESNVCQSYRSRQSVIAGAILICAGILSIIFNGISINLGEVFGFIGHGIWCGVLFIVAGAFGISAARKNRCLVGVMNALMAAMSVIAAAAAIWGSVLGCKVTCCGRTVTGTVVGSSQPVVFLTAQPQQTFVGIPQVDPVIVSSVPGGPASYDLSVANQPMLQQQTGPAYNPAIAAASAPYPSGYGVGDAMPPTKM